MAIPKAVPTMADSASGVSMTRSGPNSSISPWVALKTPPLTPTSSPMTTTRSSRRISVRSASVTACTSVRRAISASLPAFSQLLQQGLALLLQVPGQFRIHVVEHVGRFRLGPVLGLVHHLGRLLPQALLHGFFVLLGPHPAALQEAPE